MEGEDFYTVEGAAKEWRGAARPLQDQEGNGR